MRLPWKRSRNWGAPPESAPRLMGCSDPHYHLGAQEAFIAVLIAARGAVRAGPEGSTRAIEVLRHRVLVAQLHCNDELAERLTAFESAVLSVAAQTRQAHPIPAREHFVAGCREALGTDT